jgi:hypothetical protein
LLCGHVQPEGGDLLRERQVPSDAQLGRLLQDQHKRWQRHYRDQAIQFPNKRQF